MLFIYFPLIIFQVTGEKSENLIVAFCEKLTKAPSNNVGLTCLKVLWSLYQSLGENSAMRFHVYYALVTLAGKTQQIETVYKDMDTVKSQFNACPLSNEQLQNLLKLLHEELRRCRRSEEASQVMIELLVWIFCLHFFLIQLFVDIFKIKFIIFSGNLHNRKCQSS